VHPQISRRFGPITRPTVSDSDPSDGTPFNTSVLNEITPQYKRIAAFQGDVVFQAPRRWFLEHLSGKQKLWSYCEHLTDFRGLNDPELIAE
jgi:hypothetical protein